MKGELDKKFESVNENFKKQEEKIDEKLDSTKEELNKKFESLNEKFDRNEESNKRISKL